MYFYFKEYVSHLSAGHELQSTALDPDYDLFIGYQMPANKYKSLNTCLRLLHKNVNNFAELSFRELSFYNYMNHRSNTEYYE